MPAQLEANGLALQRNSRQLFSDIDFCLSPGGFLEITGANGTGKTSLLRALAGLLPFQHGHLHWLGRPINTEDHPHPWARQLAFVGHLPAMNSSLTAADNLGLYHFIDNVSPSTVLINQQLERVGLAQQRRLPVGKFSQGQLRRLMLARLLLAQKPVWLLDEPLNALDQLGIALFHTLLREHLQQGHIALVSTHRAIAPALELGPELPAPQSCHLGTAPP
jgi:heme exporter protein A